ncbi:T9SS type A sorting domain-containing protein, partial [Salinimicrobium sediminilitoris]|uniref:T9SS type A sorting domain-containing protein n=1 Tax=Salinimicrobium sediminilitoris TaxID=2876715 RepID=UPI001E30CD6A
SPADANSTCPDDYSIASITIDEALYAGEDGEDRFCEGDESKDAVNLFDLIANEDAGGIWADTDGSGVDISDPTMVDFTGLVAGSYTFTYTVTPGEGSECLADSSEVEIIIDEPVYAGVDGSVEYCEDDTALSSIDLYSIITDEEPGGSWADTDGSGVDISEPTMVDFSSLGFGTYTFTYTVSPADANSTCPDDYSIASITIDEALYAGEDGEDRFCEGDESRDAVNLFDLIADEDAGGIWADTDGSGVDISDPTVVDFTGLSAGSYTFTYTVTPGEGSECLADSSEVEIVVDPLPEPPAYQTTQADCLGGDGGLVFTDAGENLYYSVDGGEFVLYAGEIDLAVGTYTFRIRYDEDGCISDDFEVNINRPSDVVVDVFAEVIQPDCETLMGTIVITNAEALVDLNFTVTHQGTNKVYYSEVAYPLGGFTGLPVGSYFIEAISDNGCVSGNTSAELLEPECVEFTGCTLGYWKNHTDRWCGDYNTCTSYVEAFFNYEGGYNDAPAELRDLTLLEVLNLGGGGVYNFGRQSVAALLNACHEGVDYELPSTTDVIDYVRANVNNVGAAGSYLDMLNNSDCPLGGSKATKAPSDGCEDTADSGKGNKGNKDNKGKENNGAQEVSNVRTFPNPFKENFNVQYDINYKSNVEVQVFDMRGNHLRTYRDRNVSKGSVSTFNVDFALRGNQMYVLKVKTDRETFVKQIISSRK